ncbi:MAG: glycosyl hydrolase 115 family protein [Treponema sp.]|nr:glycosyl hydrolase 115 family protein [Treponema sp.]
MIQFCEKNSRKNILFYYDEKEFSGVVKIAQKVSLDVKRVTDKTPKFINKLSGQDNVVIFGTLGKCALLEEFKNEISYEKINGKRECYTFTVIGTRLIIAGSDKRGTIYGLFHLSELLGVSALVDWANIPPVKKSSFSLSEKDNYISKEPSVVYRGFFINDEWPAFGNWSKKLFGGFNVKMYEKVFELLLRLKGNYLWPAMWSSCFSDDGPGIKNAELADELGIVMGASHHEPCCRAGEEYSHLRGKSSPYGDAWNFRTNEKGIEKFWEDGLKRNGKFENVITVGMRGEADTAIMKNATLKDNIKLLRDVLKTQNSLISKYVNPDLTKVPRMLALYKEVEKYFYGDKHTKGLMDDKELDGVTLMLCDDNHGNLRTLPAPEMREHNGGYGMYYHFDYHGWPYSYEWFNTTHLSKVKEQMCMAYDFGIRNIWIVNVGDILTNEFPLSYFLNLAYDYEKYSKSDNTILSYTKNWVEFQFAGLSKTQKNKIANIIDSYSKLSHARRTECLKSDTYHPVNFNEGERVLQKAEEIIAACEQLKKEILKSNKEYFPGFFAQVYLPAAGNMNVLRMQLYAGKNKWFAQRNLLTANEYVLKVKDCLLYDKKLVNECDVIDSGRWYAMGWSEHFGFTQWNEAGNKYPSTVMVEPVRKSRCVFWIEGSEKCTTGQEWTDRNLVINQFKNPEIDEVRIFIGECSDKPLKLEIASEIKNNWLKYSVKKEGVYLRVVTVSIDRKNLSKSENKKASLRFEGKDSAGAYVMVNVLVDTEIDEEFFEKIPIGTYIQTNDYISIEAAHYNSKSADGKWNELDGYGKTLSAMKAIPVDLIFPKAKNAPSLNYNFAVKEKGFYTVDFYLNPSNPVYKDNKLQFALQVNGKQEIIDCVKEDYAVGDNQFPWGSEITDNIRIVSTVIKCKKGLNVLSVMPVTPAIVLEKLVIYDVGYVMPDSYLGAPETYRK